MSTNRARTSDASTAGVVAVWRAWFMANPGTQEVICIDSSESIQIIRPKRPASRVNSRLCDARPPAALFAGGFPACWGVVGVFAALGAGPGGGSVRVAPDLPGRFVLEAGLPAAFRPELLRTAVA